MNQHKLNLSLLLVALIAQTSVYGMQRHVAQPAGGYVAVDAPGAQLDSQADLKGKDAKAQQEEKVQQMEFEMGLAEGVAKEGDGDVEMPQAEPQVQSLLVDVAEGRQATGELDLHEECTPCLRDFKSMIDEQAKTGDCLILAAAISQDLKTGKLFRHWFDAHCFNEYSLCDGQDNKKYPYQPFQAGNEYDQEIFFDINKRNLLNLAGGRLTSPNNKLPLKEVNYYTVEKDASGKYSSAKQLCSHLQLVSEPRAWLPIFYANQNDNQDLKKQNIEVVFDIGYEAAEKKEFEKACQYYELVAQQNVNKHLKVLALMNIACIKSGLPSAHAYWERAAALMEFLTSAQRAVVWVNLGVCEGNHSAHAEKFKRALSYYEKALAESISLNGKVDILKNSGRLYDAGGYGIEQDLEKASYYFAQALEIVQDDAMRIGIQSDINKLQETKARKEIEMIFDQGYEAAQNKENERACHYFELVAQREVNKNLKVLALLLLAEVKGSSGQAYSERAAALVEFLTPADRAVLWGRLGVWEANHSTHADKYKRALDHYEKALKIAEIPLTNKVRVLQNIGRNYSVGGYGIEQDFDKASYYFAQALEIVQDDAVRITIQSDIKILQEVKADKEMRAIFDQGWQARQKKQNEKACEYYEQVAQQAVNKSLKALALLNIANIKGLLGQAYAERAAALVEFLTPAQRVKIWGRLGSWEVDFSTHAEKFKRALDYYEKALAMVNDDAQRIEIESDIKRLQETKANKEIEAIFAQGLEAKNKQENEKACQYYERVAQQEVNKPLKACALINIANIKGLPGQAYAERAAALVEFLTPANRAMLWNGLGAWEANYSTHAEKFKRALDYYEKALKIAEMPLEAKVAVLKNIGMNYARGGFGMEQSFDKAGEYYSQALAIATTPEARSQIEGNIKQLQARIAAAVKAENKKRKERPDEEGDEGGERGTKKPRMDSSSLQKKA